MMNQNPGKVTNNLVIELHIPNFQLARDFYGMFGFTEFRYDPESGGNSDLGYLVLVRNDEIGGTHLNFYGDKDKVSQHSHFKDFSSDTPRGYGVEITVPVSDVKGLWDKIKDKLTAKQIAQPLTLKRWNKWDFRVIDPFGFYIRFTELVDWGQ
ncbi:MAG: hypothetical protein WC863_03470 [Patescibacteria group bacterium]